MWGRKNGQSDHECFLSVKLLCCQTKCRGLEECLWFTWYRDDSQELPSLCLLLAHCDSLEKCDGCISGTVKLSHWATSLQLLSSDWWSLTGCLCHNNLSMQENVPISSFRALSRAWDLPLVVLLWQQHSKVPPMRGQYL